MKNWTKMIAVSALTVLVAISMAQGGGGGGQGGGRGQGGFGRGGGMGSPSGLINRADVQKDLALTDDQKTKLKDFQAKQMEEMQAQRQAGGGGTTDPAERAKMMKERQEKTEKAVNEILTPDQQKRLKEIWIQVAGASALTNEGLQKDLELSDDQKAKIKDLQTKQQEANTELRQKMQNQEIDRTQMQEIQKKNTDTMKEELLKVLTADQATKFKGMGGKEFKADPPTGRGGGN